MNKYRRIGVSSCIAALAAISGSVTAQPSSQQLSDEQEKTQVKPTVDAISVPAFDLPVSVFISEEAKQEVRQQLEYIAKARADGKALGERPDWENREFVLKMREQVDNLRKGIAQDMLNEFPVTVVPEKIAGVQTDVIVPKAGVAKKHKNRVLQNVHGGGLIFGARWEGQVGSIPLSGTGGYKVIVIDYRMAPEHVFPAASEDVAKVYGELLKKYRPENIGIFGCSAGGELAAQSVAWFQEHDLPKPGAIVIEGASVVLGIGDSAYFSSAMSGKPIKPGERPQSVAALYYKGADIRSPLIDPTSSPAMLAKFPPTLILNATRDGGMSGALYFHRQLVKARVETELHVWEGMGHCFTYNSKLPESRDAYQVEVDFFDKHLGNAAK